mgnify:CR=1 FL=1
MKNNNYILPYTLIVLIALLANAVLYFLTLFCGVGADVVAFIGLGYAAYRISQKK